MISRRNIILYIVGALAFILMLKIYAQSDTFNLKCVVSTVDGNKYCVRDREKIQESVDLLASVVGKCTILVNYMQKTYPDNYNVQFLVKNYNPRAFSETLPNSELPAYSDNKGHKIAMCLTKNKQNQNKLIDENTLMYVAIHELSHIMSKAYQHVQEFWDNFKFLLENAVKIGVINYVDYSKNPTPFCGMTITDNLLG